MKKLDSAILEILYEDYCQHPGSSSGMTLNDVLDKLGILSENSDEWWQFHLHSSSLESKEWITSKFVDDGTAGSMKITSTGMKITEDMRRNADSERQVCPGSLEVLAQQKDHDCAVFVRRDNLVDEIRRYFENRHCHFIVLHGQARVGKTKLLERLSKLLPKDEYLPLIVTPEGSNPMDVNSYAFDLARQFTDKYNDGLGRRVHISNGLDAPDENDFLNGKAIDGFYKYWGALRRKAKPRIPVLMCDEIECILDASGEADYSTIEFIYNFMCNAENGFFILTGSERIRYTQNPQFNKFIAKAKPIHVHYYDKTVVSSIFSLIRQYVTDECGALDRFLLFSDGHPHVLQTLLNVISFYVNNSPRKNKIGDEDFKRMLNKLINDLDEFLNRFISVLHPEEFYVAWLISQGKISYHVNSLEYSMEQLFAWAKDYLADQKTDLKAGVCRLVARQWAEWEDQEEKSFCFRFGIFPLWIQQRDIGLDGKP